MIECRDVVFGYKQNKTLFKDFQLTLEEGNIYGLLGRNGAGKTTLFRLISGMLFPDQGKVTVFGKEAKERTAEMLEKLFFLPEEPYLPKISGTEYLKLYSPLYPKFNTEQFRESIGNFEFELKERLTELSYGQKKKFLLSFALATNCSVILLDEPTNGLDIPAKSSFRKLLTGSIDESKIVVISTHQVKEIELLIDPIIIIEHSTVVFKRTVEEISRELRVKLHEKEPENNAGYSEKVLGGYAVLEKNTAGREENIDIELLFNAVTQNPEKINSLFLGGDK